MFVNRQFTDDVSDKEMYNLRDLLNKHNEYTDVKQLREIDILHVSTKVVLSLSLTSLFFYFFFFRSFTFKRIPNGSLCYDAIKLYKTLRKSREIYNKSSA